tara:strand:+ start:5654 stop:6841 length:1188 start_codon:yes stop_codon:yes gene_type:complete
MNQIMNKNETYIFIIWEKARNKTDEIIDDLNKNYVVRNVIEITWSKNEFLNNLRRFYGQSLPDADKKAEVCGTGPFLLIVVTDLNPKFNEPSKSGISSDRDYVNVNIFNSKEKYRKIIGKEFTVHSSISQNETNHNLTLLFGKNMNDFTKILDDRWDGVVKKIESDLIGTKGWKDMKELLYVMNGTINYVILRNFEGMPDKFDYNDIDLLVEDEKLAYIVKKDFSPMKHDSKAIELEIGNKSITLNPNYIGGYYFDQIWEKDILKRRVLHDNGFYIPSKSDYFYTLLYHIIFHDRWKKITEIREDYKKTILELAEQLKLNEITENTLDDKNLVKEIIIKYMRKSSYKRADTFTYKIKHNETSRLFKTSIFIFKKYGIRHLLYAIKLKIQFILKLR